MKQENTFDSQDRTAVSRINWPFSFQKAVYIWHHPVHSQVFSSWTGQKCWSWLSKLFKQETNWQNLNNKPFGVSRPRRNFLGISAFQMAEERLKLSNCVLILTGKQRTRWCGVCYSWLGGIDRDRTAGELSIAHFAELLSLLFSPSFIDAAQGLILTGSY